MNDQLLIGYSAWARHGGSPAARSWMTDTLGGDTLNERMTVLGAPMIGVMCLCLAAIVLPAVGKYLAFLAVPVGGHGIAPPPRRCGPRSAADQASSLSSTSTVPSS